MNARSLTLVAAFAILVCGALIRIFVGAGFQGFGFDEALYRRYTLELDARGFSGYPALCQRYLAAQRQPGARAELPPTRFLYILTTWTAKRLTFGDAPPATASTPDAKNRDPVLVSLKRVSLFFSIFGVALVGIAAWRMLGPPVGLGAMALAAAAPLSIHMGAHALVDGFFAFWATLCLWLLWENLQRPNHRALSLCLAVSLALMVVAKENAAFVYAALLALCPATRRAGLGAISRPLIIALIAGPLTGVAILIALAGGIDAFVSIYATFVEKAQSLPNAIATQDGPWHRYLVELLLLDPLVFLLALWAAFTLPAQHAAHRYLLIFFAVTYAFMASVRYGMNLRFTTIWLLPLCAPAAAQIIALCTHAERRTLIATIAVFALVCGASLRQYRIFFIDAALYEITPAQLLRATNMLKDTPRR